MPVPLQSTLPAIRGVSWLAAVGIAVGFTLLGLIYCHLVNGQLTAVYKWMYLVGCVAAALMVRRRNLFTVAILPPLILFAATFGYNWLQSPSSRGTFRGLALDVLLPIARHFFVVMAWTSAIVLAIVIARWLLSRQLAAAAPVSARPRPKRARPAEPGKRPRPAETEMRPRLAEPEMRPRATDLETKTPVEERPRVGRSHRERTGAEAPAAGAGSLSGDRLRTSQPGATTAHAYPAADAATRVGERTEPIPPEQRPRRRRSREPLAAEFPENRYLPPRTYSPVDEYRPDLVRRPRRAADADELTDAPRRSRRAAEAPDAEPPRRSRRAAETPAAEVPRRSRRAAEAPAAERTDTPRRSRRAAEPRATETRTDVTGARRVEPVAEDRHDTRPRRATAPERHAEPPRPTAARRTALPPIEPPRTEPPRETGGRRRADRSGTEGRRRRITSLSDDPGRPIPRLDEPSRPRYRARDDD